MDDNERCAVKRCRQQGVIHVHDEPGDSGYLLCPIHHAERLNKLYGIAISKLEATTR